MASTQAASFAAAAPLSIAAAAVSRAVPLLERSTAEYTRQRKCFSCHHQTMGVLALLAAREGGVAVNEENLQAIVDAFLSTPFAGGRHEQRVAKIRQLERATPPR